MCGDDPVPHSPSSSIHPATRENGSCRSRTLIVAAICVAPILPAYAADQSIDLSSGVASFTATAPILAGGDDLITFTGLAPGLYDFVFSLSSQHIGGTGRVGQQPAGVDADDRPGDLRRQRRHQQLAFLGAAAGIAADGRRPPTRANCR